MNPIITSVLTQAAALVLLSQLAACGGGGSKGDNLPASSAQASTAPSSAISSSVFSSSSAFSSSALSSSIASSSAVSSSTSSTGSLPHWVQNPNTLVNNGVAGSLNGTVITIYHSGDDNSPTGEASFAIENSGLLFIASNNTGDFWHIRINAPLEINRDYSCSTGDTQTEQVQLALNLQGSAHYQSPHCRITLNTIERLPNGLIDYIDGVFVAELTTSDSTEPTLINDGRFRFDVN